MTKEQQELFYPGRELETHDELHVEVMDSLGHGGAAHRYDIYGFSTYANPSRNLNDEVYTGTEILFQQGPVKSHGTNGVTELSLLAILIDRLERFQDGPYANADNRHCLDHLNAARDALLARKRDREARGVEGTANL